MSLYTKILNIYPDLSSSDFSPIVGTIVLQNDMDERGDYIRVWAHPVYPEPTQEQLDAA